MLEVRGNNLLFRVVEVELMNISGAKQEGKASM